MDPNAEKILTLARYLASVLPIYCRDDMQQIVALVEEQAQEIEELRRQLRLIKSLLEDDPIIIN